MLVVIGLLMTSAVVHGSIDGRWSAKKDLVAQGEQIRTLWAIIPVHFVLQRYSLHRPHATIVCIIATPSLCEFKGHNGRLQAAANACV